MKRLPYRSLLIVFLVSGIARGGATAEPISYDLRENLRNSTVYIETQLALSSGDWAALSQLAD